MQLAAYGAQDSYLTGNAQISFFETNTIPRTIPRTVETGNYKKPKSEPKHIKIDIVIDEPCTICFECIDKDEFVHKCNVCSNYFHSICIDKMIEHNSNSSCPLCRSEIVEIVEIVDQK